MIQMVSECERVIVRMHYDTWNAELPALGANKHNSIGLDVDGLPRNAAIGLTAGAWAGCVSNCLCMTGFAWD